VGPPDVSVVIPTHNRAALLRGTLDSLAAQTLARERFEVLVVDNASRDETSEVAGRFLETSGLRGEVRHEPVLGANSSRNHGVRAARGAIIAFLDDDGRADPDWLAAFLDAFADGSPSGVGGRIELFWETPPPRWTHQHYRRLLAEFDLGPARRAVARYPYLVGTNMAFRRDVFDRVGLLDPGLTRQGKSLISMDDTEFCHRVVKSGGTLLYEPRALVRHVVPPERSRIGFLLRRNYANGRSLCRLKSLHDDLDAKPSRPGALARTVLNLLRELPRGNPAESARLASSVAWHLGYLREAWESGQPQAG
jgi:glucosyl-dolichyl phosphate glucuronosyltransferase